MNRELIKNIVQHLFVALFLLLLPSVSFAQQIAIISDSHIQDVEKHPELLRSLEAQVQSTRLFNEDVFALRAALEDVGKRGVKLVIISGDVTDDGQLLNTLAAKDLLNSYEKKYDMRFFLTPGNHDPSSPFGKHSFMKGMLADDGSSYVLVSDSTVEVPGYELNFPTDKVNPEMYSLGHKDMLTHFEGFGYMPRKDYKYWASPFSTYAYEEYTYEKAKGESAIDERMFTYADNIRAYETSYVVEPVEGIWLLSVDCGVYLPDTKVDKYKNSGVGYNNTLQHKPYLIPWVKKVYDDAKRLGKRVIAFSHFPLLDFNDGASEALARSWGKSKFDIERVPSEEVSQAMFDAGVRLHFGGHMHVFDVARKTVGEETMYNVQTPSLITAVPAYNLLSVEGRHCHLETVVVKDVKGFDSFFKQYKKELEYTIAQGKKPIWSTEVLGAKDYYEFCDWQFRDLIRTRFAVRDLPKILHDEMLPLSGKELMKKVAPKSKVNKIKTQWTGLDLLVDFYRLHYSGRLALNMISAERLKDYDVLFKEIEKSKSDSEFVQQMRDFSYAFKCFLNERDEADFDI